MSVRYPSTIPREKYIRWYDDLCSRYNVTRVDIEKCDHFGVQDVYERTCNALGVPFQMTNGQRMTMNPKQMEMAFLKYVEERSYKDVVVGFDKEGYENTVHKPAMLSVAGFKVYLMETMNVQPYTTTALLSNNDFKMTRTFIHDYIEHWTWSNSGRTVGEIDVNASRLMLEHRINPYIAEHNTRNKAEAENQITPDDYREAILLALGGDNNE